MAGKQTVGAGGGEGCPSPHPSPRSRGEGAEPCGGEAGEGRSAADDLPPITLAEMIYVVTRFADDHEAFQHRRVEHGWRRTLDRAEMRKVAVLRKMGDLIDRIVASPQAREALGLRSAAKAGGDA